MNLHTAAAIANELVLRLSPVCQRIHVAGSVRRHKPDVKDIELVCIPDLRGDLFGSVPGAFVDVSDQLAQPIQLPLSITAHLRRRKNGPRYKQFYIPSCDINLDLFIVLPPAQWGLILALRTGPADYSHWLVTPRAYGGALPDGCQVRDGGLYRRGALIPAPEEADFFAALGLPCPDPLDRLAPWPRRSIPARGQEPTQ